MAPKYSRLHRFEDARDHWNAAERHHYSPRQGDRRDIDYGPLGYCSVSCNIVQISGDDGSTSADWQITGTMTAQLRADRSGNGNGRTYTIAMACSDPSTNVSATKTVSVSVPHDMGR